MTPSKFNIGDRVTNKTDAIVYCIVTGTVECIADGHMYSDSISEELRHAFDKCYPNWYDTNLLWVRLDVPIPKVSFRQLVDTYGHMYRTSYLQSYHKNMEKIEVILFPEQEVVLLREASESL